MPLCREHRVGYWWFWRRVKEEVEVLLLVCPVCTHLESLGEHKALHPIIRLARLDIRKPSKATRRHCPLFDIGKNTFADTQVKVVSSRLSSADSFISLTR